MIVLYSWKWSKLKKKDKKKKKIGSAKDLINEIKKNYPNRDGIVEINYHRKGEDTYIFSIKPKDYFAEFFARGLLHPINELNQAYFWAGLKLRSAYYSSFKHQKVTMSYEPRLPSTNNHLDNVPITDGYKWFKILMENIPLNCREICKRVIIEEKSTNGSNTRKKSLAMTRLSDGCASLHDFLGLKTKRRAFS